MAIESEGDRRGVLDRTINLGHILITLTIVVSSLSAFFDLRGRVDIHERRFGELDRRLDQEAARAREELADIKAALRRIEDKLDRKADK